MPPFVLVNPQQSKITLMQVRVGKRTPLFCGTITLTETKKGMRQKAL